MGYPEHPETIILKNKFYYSGLREIDIYNYYRNNMYNILNQVKDRDIMLAILVDINKPVIRRKIKGKFIKLTPSNFDKVITGRTISIYSTIAYYDNIIIVDIDTDTFEQAKDPTINTYNELKKASFIKNITIRYTGKTGFHIVCELPRKLKIDTTRMLIERYLLSKNELTKQYTISPKRTKGIPNIDLWASNKVWGAFITLYSLSIIGLKCINVEVNRVRSFKQEFSKI